MPRKANTPEDRENAEMLLRATSNWNGGRGLIVSRQVAKALKAEGLTKGYSVDTSELL